MLEPDVTAARDYALSRLALELPALFVYHSLWHTQHEVVPAVERLAEMEMVTGRDLLLLRSAAYFHDIGFVEHMANHERIGVRIASEILPRFGYTDADIVIIGGLIMATKLPQSPRTPLEEIIADADLDVLGRAEFWARNRDLRHEQEALGIHLTDEQWNVSQYRFLQSHRYFTSSARKLRDAGKQRHLAALAKLLSESRTQPPG